jgi:hypothetical protein
VTGSAWLRTSGAARLILAISIGGAVAGLWLTLFPSRLPGRTDIVGYPIWANFNVGRYFHLYNTITIAFPVAALLAHAVLGWAERRPRSQVADPPEPVPSPTVDDPMEPTIPGRVARLTRAALVGVAIGLEIAFAAQSDGWSFLLTVLLGTLAYLAIASLLAGGISMGASGRRFWHWHSAVNAMLVPLTVAALYGVSRSTEVTVRTQMNVDRYPWFPLVIALGGAAALLLWVSVRLRRTGGNEEGIARVERDMVMLVAGPILLLFLIAQLPGALGRMDVFHEGELLVGARLVSSGLFPWRDVGLVHGPLHDALSPLFGMKVFEESRWGVVAGFEVLLVPAVVVAFYLLHARLMRGDWVFLAVTPFVLPLLSDARFLLLPFGLLLLLGLLEKPNPVRAFGLVIVLTALSILTPEAAPFAAAVTVMLVLYEIHHRAPEGGVIASFPRTLSFGLAVLALSLGWVVYLISRGALSDFVGHYLTVARGHELTGGIPVQWESGVFIVVAPVAAVLVFGGFFAIQFRRRRLRVEDWVVAALALFVAFYYRKFLSRADHHIVGVLQVSIPLLLYLGYRFVTRADRFLEDESQPRSIRAVARYRPFSLILLVGLLLTASGRVLRTVETLPDHFRAGAPADAPIESLGYATNHADLVNRLEDLRVALAALPDPSRRIFDFTNQPGLFHYLLTYEPATRYYHVSMAIRRSSQRELLMELRDDPPSIVITLARDGLPAWDGVPNYVRHYEVSDFLFDHYRPVIWAGGSLLLLRNDLNPPAGWPAGLDLNEPPVTENLYFLGFPCDWRYAPNFLDVDPKPSDVGALDLPVRTPSGTGAVLDLPPGFRSYDWLEIRTASLESDEFILTDDPIAEGRAISFRALPRTGPRYLVRVGSCPQWHGYRAGPIRLLHDAPQDILAVRLLRSRSEGEAA